MKHFSKIVICMLVLCSTAWAIPPMPYRVGGTVVVTITELIRKTGTGLGCTIGIITTQLTEETDADYIFIATREDGIRYTPAAEDTDGLNQSDCYIIDIPIYEKNDQPDGAKPGDVAVIHVYKNGTELSVISPPMGRIIVGNEGSSTVLNLIVQDNNTDEPIYTKEDMELAVSSALQSWDVKNDRKVGLEEAIKALRVISGLQQ
jgi:hypothetical protein